MIKIVDSYNIPGKVVISPSRNNSALSHYNDYSSINLEKFNRTLKKIKEDQDMLLAEMRKRFEEWNQRMVDLITKLSSACKKIQNLF